MAWIASLAVLGIAVIWMIVALSRRHQMELLAHRLARFPERNPAPVLSLTFDGTLRYANPAARRLAARLFPDSPTVTALLPPDLPQRLAKLQQTGHSELDLEYSLNGDFYQCSLHCMDDLGICHAYLRDVTAARKTQDFLAHQAYHDDLTGLPNRRAFAARLQQAIGAGTSTAVLLLHPDQFRNMVETLGHAAGETLLKAAALRLAEITSSNSEQYAVFRFEGALFAVLYCDLPQAEAIESLAAAVHAAMTPAFLIDGREFFFPISIGASVFPNDAEDVEILLRQADTALQQVKRNGGDGFLCYTPAMDHHALQRMEIGHALRHAAERGELELHYQPQVDLALGRVTGVEALVRWHHPRLGLVPLADFIPLAEENGAIVPIGEWVLDTACARAHAWQTLGLAPLTLGVNLSPRQFRIADLPRRVERALAGAGLDPHGLELEITESAAMQDVEQTMATLRGLKAIGVKLALDDFGTGHSSLAYLQRFPLDSLKIDQSFVRVMHLKPADAAIVRSVVTLAHDLRLNVIAEGVENPAQRDLLKKMGCDRIQGYLTGKPMPEEMLLQWLAAFHPVQTSRCDPMPSFVDAKWIPNV